MHEATPARPPLKGVTMLRSTNKILGYRLDAMDGELGKVKDWYFDDEAWTIRYVVVDTGSWLSSRKVLISPQALGEPDWSAGSIPVALSKQQVEDSPGIDLDMPVSRQHEEYLSKYYGWPPYWMPSGVTAGIGTPVAMTHEAAVAQSEPSEPQGDPNLRSIREVMGYHIEAADGEIGHVEDFITDSSYHWVLRYMVIDTRNWLPGKKVLVSPGWVDEISWSDGEVRVSHNRQAIKDAPEFDPAAPVNREYEGRLYDYYGVPRYW